jgi:hypothetical protein
MFLMSKSILSESKRASKHRDPQTNVYTMKLDEFLEKYQLKRNKENPQ